MQIAVFGLGYVGLSLATMLSIKHQVVACEISEERVDLVNNRICPIKDKGIEEWFATKELALTATTKPEEALRDADFTIVSVPTNYDDDSHHFDTSAVESVLENIERFNPSTTVIIKSTIPVGFTENARRLHPTLEILFSPEFLRESKALADNLSPSRIVVGCKINSVESKSKAKQFSELLSNSSANQDTPILITDLKEAEAIKLFANTYLALRVAYFNELDTYAMSYGLDPKDIINGVCLDPRIGQGYNNPSFGYGGYCLPKDTKQLLHNFESVPQNLIEAIVKSNATRKNAIAQRIINKSLSLSTSPIIGVYRLTMKTGSDNFRQSAIFDIIEHLKNRGLSIIVYEPTIRESAYHGLEIMNDLDSFKKKSTLILANRVDGDLKDMDEKVFTRDIFRRD